MRRYAQTFPNVWIVTASPAVSSMAAMLREIGAALELHGSGWQNRALSRDLKRRLMGTQGLLVIDEAQHLGVQALEEIRAIHDAAQIGLVLSGNESVYARLSGGSRRADFAQLFSRVGRKLKIGMPSTDDVNAILSAWGVSGAKEREYAHQIASMRVPGKLPVLGHRTFILETGASTILALTPDRVQTLERMGHMVKVGYEGTGAEVNLVDQRQLDLMQQIYVLRWFEFGGVRFENIPVEVQEKEIIGLGLLRYFRTTLDFPNDRVLLEPRSGDRSIQVPFVAAGMASSFCDSDQLIVDHVAADYPAMRNGIEVGDRVLSIDGQAPAELSKYEIMEILSDSGRTVSLEMQRADRRFHIDLKLQHPFPWPPQWKPEPPEFNPVAESENQSTE